MLGHLIYCLSGWRIVLAFIGYIDQLGYLNSEFQRGNIDEKTEARGVIYGIIRIDLSAIFSSWHDKVG